MWLLEGTYSLSFLKRAVTHRIHLLYLQGLHMRYKRGARSRGKPGKVQLHDPEALKTEERKGDDTEGMEPESCFPWLGSNPENGRFRRQNRVLPSTP